MKKKYLKTYKLQKINQIKNQYKFIYFFRISKMNSKEIYNLKQNLKKNNFQFYFLKLNLISLYINNLNSQGSLILIFSNDFNLESLKLLFSEKNLNFIFLLENNKNIYLNYKIKKILKNKNDNLNLQLKKKFLFLINILKNIKKLENNNN